MMTVAVCSRGADLPLLRGCLASLFAQSPAPDDVLVVDNGGGAAELLLPEFGSRLRIAREARPGVAHARNRAIMETRGGIVAFLDDDARAEPGWLAALSSVFADPKVLAAGGPIYPEWETPAPAWLMSCSRARGTLGLQELGPRRRPIDGRREFLVGGNLACRRSAVLGEKGFRLVWPCPDVGSVAEDYELSRRLAREGTVLYEPAAAARHLIPRRKTRLPRVLRRAYAAEAARAFLGGRLDAYRAPEELRGGVARTAVAAAVLLGHLRGRLPRLTRPARNTGPEDGRTTERS